MTRVLVLAANSFVGRAVMAAIGPAAVGASRGGPVRCDVTDPAGVEALVADLRPGAVISCAGVTDGADPGPYYSVHVGGAVNVLEAVRRHVPASPVVLLGSAAEYGPVGAEHLPVREDHAPAPATFYGASKLAQTHLGLAAVAAWGLRVRVARLFNVIGAGLPSRYFLGALACRLKALPPGSTFPVRDAAATRDLIDARDAAAALALLARPDVPSGVYNVATGAETAVGAAAGYLGELAGGMTPVPADGPAGGSRSAGDASRLRDLGWSPAFGWRDAVRACWDGHPARGRPASVQAR
ncbi:MAG: NAD-dependent epimerase/dehydratase family protein [Gemmataceae bacterium]